MAKDPKRQLLGKIARQKGQYFEQRLDSTFDYYRERGYAEIEKTPEPMKVIKPEGNGRFLACYTKKAQVDYKGTTKGGRTVLFEAKFTATDRLTQDRVIDKQASYMDRHQRLGARCFVVAGFSTDEVYKIPWDDWRRMKELFGRKYVKETDLQNYRVKTAWNGTLFLLD